MSISAAALVLGRMNCAVAATKAAQYKKRCQNTTCAWSSLAYASAASSSDSDNSESSSGAPARTSALNSSSRRSAKAASRSLVPSPV